MPYCNLGLLDISKNDCKKRGTHNHEVTKMQNGMVLKAARQKAGLNQNELGDRVGVTGQYIGKLERGEAKNPSREILQRIAQVLDIPFEVLLYGNDAREGVSEQSILMAQVIEKLPDKAKIEINAIMIRALHEVAQKTDNDPRLLLLPS
jgi:transcriptional regulator with XRE-family HTH domain